MGALLCLIEVKLSPAGDHVLLVLEIMIEKLFEIEHLGLAVDQRQVDDAERIPQLCVLIKMIEHDVGVGVAADVDADLHALAARVVVEAGDPVDLFIADEVRDRLDESRLVDKIGKLRDEDLRAAVLLRLDARDRLDRDLAAPRAVGLLYAAAA